MFVGNSREISQRDDEEFFSHTPHNLRQHHSAIEYEKIAISLPKSP